MTLKKSLLMTPLLALGLTLSGCWWLAAGAAGGYVYKQGNLKQVEQVSLDEAHAAVLAAVEELELQLRNENKDAMVSVINARTADRKDVSIKINKLSDTSSEFSIRVGLGITGSEGSRAALIMSTIKKHL